MALKVLVKPAVLIAALALFCYMSLEISMGTWIKQLMEELFGGDANVNASAKAGLVLSLFGVTMMAGRFLTSSIKNLTAMGSKVIIFASVLILTGNFSYDILQRVLLWELLLFCLPVWLLLLFFRQLLVSLLPNLIQVCMEVFLVLSSQLVYWVVQLYPNLSAT